MFTRAGTARYTHPLVLAAEQRLLDAHADTTAPTVPSAAPSTEPAAAATVPDQRIAASTEVPLAADQARAVHAVCTSGRRLEVLVGPAGSGKTTTLRAVRRAWERHRGAGSVIGLAPSATAARELARSLGDPVREHRQVAPRDPPRHRRGTWRMRPGQLVIVDEASLASTHTLDALAGQARAADAKVLLVGDHHQLGPVDAGGAFTLLADDGQPLALESLWRFTHPWEAHATLRLRAGDPDVLDTYDRAGRLHDGPYEDMLEAAYQAWTRDTARRRGECAARRRPGHRRRPQPPRPHRPRPSGNRCRRGDHHPRRRHHRRRRPDRHPPQRPPPHPPRQPGASGVRAQRDALGRHRHRTGRRPHRHPRRARRRTRRCWCCPPSTPGGTSTSATP